LQRTRRVSELLETRQRLLEQLMDVLVSWRLPNSCFRRTLLFRVKFNVFQQRYVERG
jgi:hypothetical protein